MPTRIEPEKRKKKKKEANTTKIVVMIDEGIKKNK